MDVIQQDDPPSDAAAHAFEPTSHHHREVLDPVTGRMKAEAYDPRSPEEVDHDVYVAAIVHAFNPRDDDASQVSILVDALDNAFAFIVAQPCTCPVGTVGERIDQHNSTITDYFGLQCSRCRVLGRSNDRRIER